MLPGLRGCMRAKGRSPGLSDWLVAAENKVPLKILFLLRYAACRQRRQRLTSSSLPLAGLATSTKYHQVIAVMLLTQTDTRAAAREFHTGWKLTDAVFGAFRFC